MTRGHNDVASTQTNLNHAIQHERFHMSNKSSKTALSFITAIWVDTNGIDKFVQIARDDVAAAKKKYVDSKENELFHSSPGSKLLLEHRASFAIHRMAVVNCYSLFDNNFRKILKLLPNVTDATLKNMWDEKGGNKIYQKHSISPPQQNDIVQEFREVCNAIKHNLFSYDNAVTTTKDKKEYDTDGLSALYDKRSLLQSYLTDLHRQVNLITSTR